MEQQIVGRPLERRIAELAARQHGLITHEQLLALGLSASGIAKRLRRGALYRVHRGVYAVRYPTLTRQGEWLAAVLAVGDGAALSHASAAALWELLPQRTPRIDVTVATPGGRSRRRLIVVHRMLLDQAEVTVRDGVPVTTVVRTLLDLADVLPQRRLERALDEASYLGFDLARLSPRWGRRGYGKLTRVLRAHELGSTWTRSELEEAMLAVCRRAGLPRPKVNTEVEGKEVDFHWPSHRLVVETDGWRSHGRRTAFERDRVRDALLVEAGWRVIRITKRRLAAEPGAVAAQLSRLLAASDGKHTPMGQ